MNRKSATLLLCLTACALAQKAPERRVDRNTITSASNPAVRLEVPAAARYRGAERWDLYGVADCGLHVSVEADERKVIGRPYWVRFEAFLPSKPESRYRYPFTQTTQLGGMEFDVRTRFGATGGAPRPDSGGGHVEAMVKAAGYQLPRGTMNVRLVHPAADLEAGGKDAARWPELQRGLLERVAARVQFGPLAK